MGYKCANCNVDFPTRKALVEHNITVHNTVSLDDDNKALYLKVAKEKGKTELVKQIEESE